MFTYSVYAFCDECSVPHQMGITIQLAEELSPTQSVGDIYDGRDLPEQIARMTDNTTTCPRTGRMFKQRDNHQVFLVRTAV